MKRILLEVCVETLADAQAAERGGADRLEVCAALEHGGLTPSVQTVLTLQRMINLPLVVMIRHRPGHFVFSSSDVAILLNDIGQLRQLGVSGFVFGALLPHDAIDLANMAKLCEACGDAERIFHRAFDAVPNKTEALEQLIELGVQRVLTSGGAETALGGADTIAGLSHQAAGRIEVMPGCGIRPENVWEIVQRTGCTQVHGSFSRMQDRKPFTCEATVRSVREVLDEFTSTTQH